MAHTERGRPARIRPQRERRAKSEWSALRADTGETPALPALRAR